jgi:hypothetical protein
VPLTEGWVVAILYVLGFFILLTLVAIPPYVQSGLNKVWNLYPLAEDGQAQLPLTAAEPQPAPAASQAPPPGPPPDPADRLD